MKGMLYLFGFNNKGAWWLIGACFAVAAALCIAATRAFTDNIDLVALAGMASFFLPLFISVIPGEVLIRDFEKNLKCRFASYALAGMTKHSFALTELVKHLLSTVLSLALDFALLGMVILAGGSTLVTADVFILHALIIVAGMGLLNWIAVVPIIHFKSQEKGSLLVGLPFGIVVGIAASVCMYNDELEQKMMELLNKSFTWQGQLIIYAVVAALYALFYLVLYKKLRKGDV